MDGAEGWESVSGIPGPPSVSHRMEKLRPASNFDDILRPAS